MEERSTSLSNARCETHAYSHLREGQEASKLNCHSSATFELDVLYASHHPRRLRESEEYQNC